MGHRDELANPHFRYWVSYLQRMLGPPQTETPFTASASWRCNPDNNRGFQLPCLAREGSHRLLRLSGVVAFRPACLDYTNRNLHSQWSTSRVNVRHADHRFRLNRRVSEVGTVPLFQGCDQLGEIPLLVNLNQQVMGIDEVPQLLGCELKQGGVSSAAVQRLQHQLPPIRASAPLLPDQTASRRRLFQQPRPRMTTLMTTLVE